MNKVEILILQHKTKTENHLLNNHIYQNMMVQTLKYHLFLS